MNQTCCAPTDDAETLTTAAMQLAPRGREPSVSAVVSIAIEDRAFVQCYRNALDDAFGQLMDALAVSARALSVSSVAQFRCVGTKSGKVVIVHDPSAVHGPSARRRRP